VSFPVKVEDLPKELVNFICPSPQVSFYPQHVCDKWKKMVNLSSVMKCERWIDQHDTSMVQKNAESHRSQTHDLPNKWIEHPPCVHGGNGSDSCQGRRIFLIPRSCHVDQFTFNNTWLVPLQSEDVFELGGITKEIVKQPVFAREGGCWFTRPWICFYNSFLEASKDMLIRSLEGKITPCF